MRAALPLLCLLALGCVEQPCEVASIDRPNVTLIVIDTVRADHLSHHGYGRDTSPALSELAGRGTMFMRTMASSPWTGPSVASIVTGKYPDEVGMPELGDPLPATAITLAEIFKSHGYETAAISSNGYVSKWFGHDQGYDFFHHTPCEEGPEPICFNANKVTEKTLEWLETVSAPFFLYVHYSDPHEPYRPPDEWRNHYLDEPAAIEDRLLRDTSFTREPLSPRQLDAIVGVYDAEIRFVDHELARLLERLPGETLTVVTGDHGEEFLDHGSFLHGHTLYDELLYVPLVVQGPGVCSRSTVDEVVSHVDIAPTLLEYAGAPTPRDMSGRSLRPYLHQRGASLDERPVYAVRQARKLKGVAARLGRWKLLYDVAPQRAVLFDLAEDPGEKRALPFDHAAEGRQLLAAVREREALLQDAASVDPEGEEERNKILRSLGYVD